MTSKRYDIMTPRPRKDSDKPYWHKIGSAFEGQTGVISLVFDSLPLPDKDGRCFASLFEPREKTKSAPAKQPDDPGPAQYKSGLADDEIPF